MKALAICILLLGLVSTVISANAWHRKFIDECNTYCFEYNFALYKNGGIKECCGRYIDDGAEMKDWLCHRNIAICIYE